MKQPGHSQLLPVVSILLAFVAAAIVSTTVVHVQAAARPGAAFARYKQYERVAVVGLYNQLNGDYWGAGSRWPVNSTTGNVSSADVCTWNPANLLCDFPNNTGRVVYVSSTQRVGVVRSCRDSWSGLITRRPD